MDNEALSWSSIELKTIALGDKRLNKRSIQLLEGLAVHSKGNVPSSLWGWGEVQAAYRFFDNDKVTHEKLLSAHYDATLERCRDEDMVFVLHDTSSLNFTGLKMTQGLGDIGDSKNKNAQGLIFHTAYAVTPNRLALGLIDQKVWAREESAYKSSVKRSKTAIKQKESRKWLDSLEAAHARLNSMASKVVHMMDREADIYDVFSEAKDLEANFIIRARHNRRVNKRSRGADDGVLMLSALYESKALGEVTIEVPSKSFLETKRTAHLQIRTVTINVPAPRGKSIKDHKFTRKSLNLTLISAKELIDDEDDDSIDWLLLTNVKIGSVEEVLFCLDAYCCRWQIEVFHRILKTGCKVEECRFSDAKKIGGMLALLSVVAWRFHWMSVLARVEPEQPADVMFSKLEQTVLCRLVQKKAARRGLTLKYYMILLARLGGFLARKHDGMPGAEVLWRGWRRLKDTISALDSLQGEAEPTYV